MKKLILELDYMSGPILKDFFDVQKNDLCTGIDVIDYDPLIQKMNEEIQNEYSALYIFDKNEQAVTFNETAAKKIKFELLSKIAKLSDYLNCINDGTFNIEDRATKLIEQW